MRHWFLPATMLLISLLSLLTLQSIANQLVLRQLVFMGLGAVIFVIASKTSFHRLLSLGGVGYLLTILLLIATLVIATETRNTSRWIEVGSLFVIQPSQLAIPATALLLAQYLNRRSLTKIKHFLTCLSLIALPAILIMLEPDLGTTLAFLASLGVIFYLMPSRGRYLAGLFIGTLMIAVTAWTLLLKPYQKERIFSFVEPDQQTAASYNARQALIAVGSGEIFGQGLGRGIQSHLRFLPERQTDFIFASFAEEFGLIGSLALVLLYTGLVFFLFQAMTSTTVGAEQILLGVVATMFLVQSTINIGMNLGLLPITGITLPFFSYGGSSILSLAGTLGIIQSLLNHQHQRAQLHLS